jgi:hypothetical protein
MMNSVDSGNDGVVTQVLEEVLAVLAVADVVFAEDQVVAVVAQLADRDPGGHGELDLADAARVEHVAKLRPHGRIGFDDEGGDGAEIITGAAGDKCTGTSQCKRRGGCNLEGRGQRKRANGLTGRSPFGVDAVCDQAAGVSGAF